LPEHLAIVGSGAIATGLAATVAAAGDDPVTLCARSEQSAERARARIATLCERFEPPASYDNVTITTSQTPLGGATFIVEAIAEDLDAKEALFAELAGLGGDDVILASTTSSLSIEQLAAASQVPERFVGLHVFNPVTRMELVELVFPARATDATRERSRALCDALGKTPIEVPDLPGFVVNSLLFPFLFGAVELQAKTGIDAEDLDSCLRLGAGHAMGPLAVLDMVGLDVSIAIAERIGVVVPQPVYELVAAGKLGRKSGEGFHSY
jgi:3-hydroxybutyryl-CoA dehydrogenase